MRLEIKRRRWYNMRLHISFVMHTTGVNEGVDVRQYKDNEVLGASQKKKQTHLFSTSD